MCACFAHAPLSSRFRTRGNFLPCLTPLHQQQRSAGFSKHRRRLRRSFTPPIARAIDDAVYRASIFKGPLSTGIELARELLNALPSASSSPISATDGISAASEDGRQLGALYEALSTSGALRAFGSAKVQPRAKSLSLSRMASEAGLRVSSLSPRSATVVAWQAAGFASVAIVVLLTRALHMPFLARPLLMSTAALFLSDQLLLRGALFEGVYRTIFPRYREKIVVHEAGHFLCAYLYGLPVRGFVLSAAQALRAGFPGQAGTLFFDENLARELDGGRLTKETINRHSMVLMAGIAAEAITFGEAEGGESDVNSLLELLTSLSPPWSEREVRLQARWAVLQAVRTIRENITAFEKLSEAMREERPLGDCIEVIEKFAVAGSRNAVEGNGIERDVGDENTSERKGLSPSSAPS